MGTRLFHAIVLAGAALGAGAAFGCGSEPQGESQQAVTADDGGADDAASDAAVGDVDAWPPTKM